jgi:hypothetical protein
MEAVIQISEVNSKDVNTSRGTSTVYNIKSSEGKEFSTFKKDLGQAAGKLRGQWATVEYQEVQKGKYTNYYLDAVRASEPRELALNPTASYVDTETTGGLTEAPGTTPGLIHPTITPAQAVSHNFTYKDDKSAQINRSVAFKAAVGLVTSGYVDFEGVDGIDRLTSELIPVVEGTFTAPLSETNPSSGEPGDIVDSKGSLVDF